jgi:hypothetical protein
LGKIITWAASATAVSATIKTSKRTINHTIEFIFTWNEAKITVYTAELFRPINHKLQAIFDIDSIKLALISPYI